MKPEPTTHDDGTVMPADSHALAPSPRTGGAALATAAHLRTVRDQEFLLGRTVQTALRGRYPLVIALGIVTGVVGALAGWKLMHPSYSSTGLVRIASERPNVLTDTDQNKPLVMFETFMQSQRQLIVSRRVIDAALRDPAWQAPSVEVPTDPEVFFTKYLKVSVSPKSEFIEIVATDKNPATAAAAVSSVIRAYADLYTTQERLEEQQRFGVLNDKQAALEREVEGLSSTLRAGAREFGTTDLAPLVDAAIQRLNNLQATLEEVRAAIAAAPTETPAPANAGASPATRPAAASPLTTAQIAAADPTMRGYLDEEFRAREALEALLRRLGNNHDAVIVARQSLERAHARVTEYAEAYRQNLELTVPGRDAMSIAPAAALGARSLQSLRESERRLAKLCEDEQRKMVLLGNMRIEQARLRGELEAKQLELATLKKRIDVLRAERSMGGRLSVASGGEVPLAPIRDRRLLCATAGGLAGAGLPAAALVLVTMLASGRYRYADEADGDVAPGVPLLGILPALRAGGAGDDAGSCGAALCVHQIRITLRSQAPPDRPSSVYLVTSAAAGEGKTSLTMSLGLSFAASRLRTLVVDADLAGRRLTGALRAQAEDGLHEALAAGSLRAAVRRQAGDLYVLTAGRGGAQEACSLSRGALRPLIAQARRSFDVVLIDTGPILGSVEASVLAQEVDGVLFTIGRDQQRALVERAVRRLGAVGARLEGFIFNRARRNDFDGSLYGYGSIRSGDGRDPPPVKASPPEAAEELVDFGPLVRAVASRIPSVAPAAVVAAGA